MQRIAKLINSRFFYSIALRVTLFSIFIIFATIASFDHIYNTIAVTGLLISECIYRAHKYNLSKRAEKSSNKYFDVEINGKAHYKISERDYAAIAKTIYSNPEPITDQLILYFLALVKYLLITIPLIVFWIIICFYALAPNNIVTLNDAIMSAAQTQPLPQLVPKAVKLILYIALSISILLFAIKVHDEPEFCPSPTHEKSVFNKMISEAIRNHLGIKEEGSVKILSQYCLNEKRSAIEGK